MQNSSSVDSDTLEKTKTLVKKARSPKRAINTSSSELPELTIVIPTFNEKGNIRALVQLLDRTLRNEPREYLFVDDNSPDGTADEVRAVAAGRTDIRVIERIGKRGLASACADGVMASSSPYILVMDADLQHDETIIPQLFDAVRDGSHDIASGTRFSDDHKIEGLSLTRKALSVTANALAGLVSGQKLKDPMSGFFLFRREDFMKALPKMACAGYKVYFDFLCASPRSFKVKEVGYCFRERHDGESKLDMGVLWEYVLLLVSKMTFRLMPIRFIGFCLVGFSGVFVHLLTVFGLFHLGPIPYLASNICALGLAMLWNYYWNNTLTYKHTRQRGKAFYRGMLAFILISSTAALVSALIADWIYRAGIFWLIASLAGIIYSAVWNFALSRWLVWKKASPAI